MRPTGIFLLHKNPRITTESALHPRFRSRFPVLLPHLKSEHIQVRLHKPDCDVLPAPDALGTEVAYGEEAEWKVEC